MVLLMARKPLERSIAPHSSEMHRESAMPRRAPNRLRSGVAAYQHAMEIKYHGAEVNAHMRVGVRVAPLMRASAS